VEDAARMKDLERDLSVARAEQEEGGGRSNLMDRLLDLESEKVKDKEHNSLSLSLFLSLSPLPFSLLFLSLSLLFLSLASLSSLLLVYGLHRLAL